MTNDLRARAEQARREMTEAVYEHIIAAGQATNAEVARALGLQSSSLGGQKNHLSHALLADLVRNGRITREKNDGAVQYARNRG